MKDRIENLKQELREFIELSKRILGEKWYYWDQESNDYIATGENEGKLICSLAALTSRPKEFSFIARSRNISPAMAECLLVAVEGLEMIAFIQENQVTTHAYASNRDLSFNGRNAFDKLQQILNIWEAAK